MSTKKCYYTEKTLGARLKAYREDKGLTLVQLGQAIGITHSALSGLENNKSKPSTNTLASLCKNTNIDIVLLLTGEDTPENKAINQAAEEVSIYNDRDGDPGVADLLIKTRAILKSDTDYSASLAANIRSFHHAIKTEDRLNEIEKKVLKIENKAGHTDCIRKDDPESARGKISKKRVM